MRKKFIQFGNNHKFTSGLLIIDLIIFILLFPTQGLLFIILSFVFWVFFLIGIGLLLKIISNSIINKNLKTGIITDDGVRINKGIWTFFYCCYSYYCICVWIYVLFYYYSTYKSNI